jgi:S-methylmethionine-dependent homocysteine/selenocysteine methylase
MTNTLPQLDRLFLTDAGLETDLIFNRGVELRSFAAITLLETADGRAELDRYFRQFLELAREAGTGLILETASWRASPDWAEPLGFDQSELDRLNRESVRIVQRLRDDYPDVPIIISGCIGPRGDGYDPGKIMRADEADAYHLRQASTLAAAGADMLTALTMTNSNEAIGIARVAQRLGIPVAISFTVETNGALPTGQSLGEAIAEVDAATGGYPAYFMVNCAHPSHFQRQLLSGGDWVGRIRGVRANASRCSHAELDMMTELDDGNPRELGEEYRALREKLPQLTVLGGCCGTDYRHIAAIAEAVREDA